MGDRRLLGEHAGGDGDSGRFQPRVSLSIHPQVRIGHRGDHAGDAGRDQRIGAGRRFAVMGAGLERDIDRGPARRCPGLGQRHRLGVGTAAGSRPAAADDDRCRSSCRTTSAPTAGLG